jgi:hypothetical protein
VNSSLDIWALKHGGFENAFTVKLPDSGEFGYLLPANLIKPVADEFVNSLGKRRVYANKDYLQIIGALVKVLNETVSLKITRKNKCSSNLDCDTEVEMEVCIEMDDPSVCTGDSRALCFSILLFVFFIFLNL